MALLALSLPACQPTPISPTPIEISSISTPSVSTPTLALTSAPAATATLSPEAVRQAAASGWEEMFRTTNTYEYVSAKGRPADKDWWVEQAKRFYTGQILTDQLNHINTMFNPRSGIGIAPAFIEAARYDVTVERCPSDTECVLTIAIKGGTFWSYDIRQQQWHKATPVEPGELTVWMRYDAAATRWKISQSN